jgi:hypothetical protein
MTLRSWRNAEHEAASRHLPYRKVLLRMGWREGWSPGLRLLSLQPETEVHTPLEPHWNPEDATPRKEIR